MTEPFEASQQPIRVENAACRTDAGCSGMCHVLNTVWSFKHPKLLFSTNFQLIFPSYSSFLFMSFEALINRVLIYLVDEIVRAGP